MVAFQQARRIHQICALNCVENIGDGDAGREQLRGIGSYLELGFLTALDDYGGDTLQAIQPRLHLIGRHLPELGLRHGVGSDAVSDDREAREGHAVRFDPRSIGEFGLHS